MIVFSPFCDEISTGQVLTCVVACGTGLRTPDVNGFSTLQLEVSKGTADALTICEHHIFIAFRLGTMYYIYYSVLVC